MKKIHFEIAIQQTKPCGMDIIELDDYIFFNSGGENRKLGTGFKASRP